MRTCPLLLFLVVSLFHSPLTARVLRVEITSRTSVLDSRAWGKAGAYELLRGKVYYGIDPNNPYNQRITDLALAPRNNAGLVEAVGDLVVLQAVDPANRRGTALVEVSNRGGKFSPSYFNRAARGRELDPNDPDYWGDGLLMRQGLTVIWIGWQFDIPDGEHNLTLTVPAATHPDGTPIRGLVRSDWAVDEPTTFLSLAHRNLDLKAYPVADPTWPENVLTVRDGRDAPRRVIPRSRWRFARIEAEKVIPSDQHIILEGGFRPGKIYELVYRSENPPVVGLGQAAIRDIIAYAKYDPDCPFPVERGIAAGVSQTGRFLRYFLYKGFNTDESGRPAYDGLMIITAGAGRGSFNHRFAQPSRDAHRYSTFFYPTDIFPFTSRELTDPLTGQTDGLLSHLHDTEHAPKTFYINTGYEYWGRAASLLHTSADGTEDVVPLPHERIYHLAGGQHFVDRWPPVDPVRERIPYYRGNPLEIKVNYRAMLLELIDWVETGAAPPGNRYPSIREGTLVSKEETGFPILPGLGTPTTIHNAYRTDYGPRWEKEGVIDFQPPKLGYSFPSKVARVDSLGNELGGVRNVELRVPLATYTPWNLRYGLPANQHELLNFRGTYVPLPRTEAERRETEDPRPSIESLYQNREDFLKKVSGATMELVTEGFLLAEDTSYVRERSAGYWDWLHRGDPRAGLSRGPERGSLLIIGGGQLDSVFYQIFMERAGGPEAPIVVIPTAGGDEYLARDTGFVQLKKRFTDRGFQQVTILHTRDRAEADSKAFTRAIEAAGGVWFMGGRQWRLADSYLHTRTHRALRDLLDRNGVIAGSSAGATIQGSYLARGDTRGNTLMMGDHEEGLGFLTNVAIDQHLLARNRQFDLFEILQEKPELLGIGLDENTGILVRSDRFEVLGAGYVAVYDGKKWSAEREAYFPLPERFYLLRTGQRYDLSRREVIRE